MKKLYISVARTATNAYEIRSIEMPETKYAEVLLGDYSSLKTIEKKIYLSIKEATTVLNEKMRSGKYHDDSFFSSGCTVQRPTKEENTYVIKPNFGGVAMGYSIMCNTSIILKDANSMEDYIARAIRFAITSHKEKSKSPEKRTRKWDHETPYGIHPIWCATAILHETMLEEELRWRGAIALLLHDILEDTTEGFPTWVTNDVCAVVGAMTFSSTEDEMQEIWSRSTPFVRLLKLYDKVSNLMDGAWMPDEKRKTYAEYIRKLADDVGKNFGELNIVKITRALTINLATP